MARPGFATRTIRLAAALLVVSGSLAVPAATLAAAPAAVATPASVAEDGAAILVALKGIDADGDATTVTIDGPPSLGALGTLSAPLCDGLVPETCTAEVPYTPDPDASGLDTFGFSVSDGVDTTAGTATVTVTQVNDAPSFSGGADATVLEDAGPQVVAGWASGMSPGPATEGAQALAFTAIPADASLFAAGPAVDASTGDLTFTPAANANGSTSVAVALGDDGGTTNGGVDTSAPHALTITIAPVNDAPTAGDDPDPRLSPPPFDTVFPIEEDHGLFECPNVAPVGCALINNDADIDGDPLTYELLDPPDHGSLVWGPALDGSYGYTPDPDFSTVWGDLPSDTFTYRVFDGIAYSAPATMRFWVAPVNDPPTFTPGSTVSVLEDSGPYSALWATAIDAGPGVSEDGQTVGFEILDVDTNGVAGLFAAGPSIDSAGVLSFTPAPDKAGLVHVTIDAKDDGGLESYSGVPITPDDTSEPVTFDIVVWPVNDAPTFVLGPGPTVSEDAGLRHHPQASDRSPGPGDPDQALTFEVIGNTNPALFSAQPSLSAADGVVTYQPAPDAHGSADITVVLRDDGGTADGGADASAPQTFTITVTPVNDVPTAGDDVLAIAEDAPATAVAVLANDGDADAGTILKIVEKTNGAKGTVAITGGGTGLTYRPVANAVGADSFTYRISDGAGGRATATVSVTIGSVNDAPTADAEAYPATEDTTLVVSAGSGLLVGDADADGDPLLAVLVAAPAIGTLVLADDGSFTYSPAADDNGVVTFTYRARDPSLAVSPIRTVTLTIAAVNDTPTFINGADQAVLEDAGPRSVPGWASGISAGATDESGQALAFIVSTTNAALFSAPPAIGPTGALTWTPAPDAFGMATVTVRLRDDGSPVATSAPVTFKITVGKLNDTPSFTAGPDQTVAEDVGPQTVAGWATDRSPGPDNEAAQALSFLVSTSNAALFSAAPAVAPDGTLSYTPAADANGSATVTVRIRDNGGTASGGVDTSVAQTLAITVSPVNDAPSFTAGSDRTVAEDAGAQTVAGWATAISAGPDDEDGQALSFHVSTANPTLFAVAPTVGPGGALTFTPAANRNGTATVTITLGDDGGTAGGGDDTSAAQTLTITVSPVNDPPNAANDTASIEAGSPATAVPVLANDSAVPDTGETLRIEAISTAPPAAHGTATITGGGTGLTFRPAAGFSGVTTFAYRLSDGHGATDTATVRVTVTPDVTKPAVGVPTAELVAPSTAAASTVRVRIRWTASDGSGLRSTQLQRSLDGGTTWSDVTLASSTAKTALADLAVGSTYRHRVRATDPAGNVSAWQVGPKLRVERVQDTSASLAYTGTWTPRSVPAASGGTVRFATGAGASAELRFTGRAVALVAQKEATSGSVDIYVDGTKVATVSLRATVATARQVVWSASWPTSAPRTLKVVVRGNGRVDLDAVPLLRDVP